MLTQILINEGLMLLAGIVGYYLGHRGMTGVISDLEDVKTDVTHIKARMFPSVTTPVQPPMA